MARAKYGNSTSNGNSRGESQETNISVVVRIRPRNSIEVNENSQVIVRSASLKSKEIYVKTGLGDAATKTYTFDKVFGPDADQEMVFNDVVSPMLEEVLMGYNCTIFAYGQTGTGKTYTMEGSIGGGLNSNAGIIPRTLYSLFETIGSAKYESAVRISCTELYCEELRDLLSDDDYRKLRLYEDSNRKGAVIVQGLEEILVKNIEDVLNVLETASSRRQMAATKMNEHSSRSHCIFTITVRIKEPIEGGEELVKVGKLNLVDLAGSENIGRSGAFNRQAKEAGIINTSLLTLGRVINALVERSPHVPYRESKLTRILQDSLGGKTKTCIIAAISPARCNLEETLSTLDYAHRAKNIRNRPEVNQKMTKRAVLREYEDQIDRLKADLTATRERNGIFMDPENYQALVTENGNYKLKIDELFRLVVTKEDALSAVTEKFEKNMELLTITGKELERTRAELQQKHAEFEHAVDEALKFQQQYLEQEKITQAYVNTERLLHDTASNLVSTLDETVNDLDAIHTSLTARVDKETSDINKVKSFHNEISNELTNSTSNLQNLKNVSNTFHEKIFTDMEEYLMDHNTFMNESGRNMHNMFDVFLNKISELNDKYSKEDSTINNELLELKNMASNVAVEFNKMSTNYNTEIKTIVDNVVTSINETDLAVKEITDQSLKQVNNTQSLIANVLTETIDNVDSNYSNNIIELEKENEILKSKIVDLDSELQIVRQQQQDSSEELVNNISNLIVAFNAESHNRNKVIAEKSMSYMTGISTNLSDIRSNQDTLKSVICSKQESCSQIIQTDIDILKNNIIVSGKQCAPKLEVSKTTIAKLNDHLQNSSEEYHNTILKLSSSVENTIQQTTGILQGEKDLINEMTVKCKESTDGVLNDFSNRIEHIREQHKFKLKDLHKNVNDHSSVLKQVTDEEVERFNNISKETQADKIIPFDSLSIPPRKVFNYPREFPRTVITYSDENVQ